MDNTRKGFTGAVIASLLLIISFFAISSYKARNFEKDIHINEVMSDNLSTISDNRGGHTDWIEIYSTADSTVNLKGFKLRAGERGSEQYTFPDIDLEAGKFLLIFASEKYMSDFMTEDMDSKFSIKNYFITGRGTVQDIDADNIKESEYLYAPLKLAAGGTRVALYGKTGTPVDEVDVPKLRYNTSYARVKDGTGDFEVMTASPGKSNELSEELIVPSRKGLKLSRSSGFYEKGFALELKDDRDSEIYYTTDGSDPIKNGILYTEPISIGDKSKEKNRYSDIKEVSCFFTDPTSVQIKDEQIYRLPSSNVDKATVIRATSIGTDGSFNEIETGVYFVGYEGKSEYENIPVMSLVTDSDNLFGYENGIYVTGKTMDDYLIRENEDNVTPWDDANYRNRGIEWEREAVMTCFTPEKKLEAQQNVGIRIKGNWSRAYPQKSLNIYAREEYGSDIFDTVFFEGDKYERVITMFNGGNDASYKLEDTIAADMAAGREAVQSETDAQPLNFSVMRHYPCYLFLNGEYWGIMDLSEKFGEDYIVRHFGVDEGNVVMIKNLETEVGTDKDIELYEQLRYLVYTGEFDKKENYDKFCDAVDIESLLDYYAFRIYIGNRNDWPARNFALWRTREKGSGEYEDCKWRFMLFDVNNKSMDLSDAEEGFDFISYVRQGDNMFDELMKSSEFESLFYNRLKKLSETNCSAENAYKLVESRRSVMEEPMKGWYKRFADDESLICIFNDKADKIEKFFEKRRNLIFYVK